MSKSAKMIVAARVKYKDRVALEKMREHWQRHKSQLLLKAGGPYDLSAAIKSFDDDLAAIDDGLSQLDGH